MHQHREMAHGVKRFCCGECGKGYTNKYFMDFHWRREHVDSQNWPFECKCGKKFASKGELTRHSNKEGHGGED